MLERTASAQRELERLRLELGTEGVEPLVAAQGVSVDDVGDRDPFLDQGGDMRPEALNSASVREGTPALHLAQINTEISLIGIASADLVLTGGGDSQPYQFTLENVVMS